MEKYKEFNKGYCKLSQEEVYNGVYLFPNILIYPECDPLVISKNILDIKTDIKIEENNKNEEKISNEDIALKYKNDNLEKENLELKNQIEKLTSEIKNLTEKNMNSSNNDIELLTNEKQELELQNKQLNDKLTECIEYIKKVKPYIDKMQQQHNTTTKRGRKSSSAQTKEQQNA